ncbi:MAG: sulfurtransferase TusA family protein [Candidatus Bathyarchaeia archaeon]
MTERTNGGSIYCTRHIRRGIPVPLIKFRRSLDKLEKDSVLLVIGTHEESRVDIIRTTKQLKMELIKVETDKDGKWRILIRKL